MDVEQQEEVSCAGTLRRLDVSLTCTLASWLDSQLGLPKWPINSNHVVTASPTQEK